MEKCPKCKTKFAKYPWKDEQGKINWINLFRIDWYTLMWFCIVLYLLIMYQHDTKECIKILEDPIEFCETSNSCDIINAEIYNKEIVEPSSNFTFGLT